MKRAASSDINEGKTKAKYPLFLNECYCTTRVMPCAAIILNNELQLNELTRFLWEAEEVRRTTEICSAKLAEPSTRSKRVLVAIVLQR